MENYENEIMKPFKWCNSASTTFQCVYKNCPSKFCYQFQNVFPMNISICVASNEKLGSYVRTLNITEKQLNNLYSFFFGLKNCSFFRYRDFNMYKLIQNSLNVYISWSYLLQKRFMIRYMTGWHFSVNIIIPILLRK